NATTSLHRRITLASGGESGTRKFLPNTHLPGGPAMLDYFQATSRNCQGISRRAFLRVGALSGLGLSLPSLFAGRQASAAQGKKTKDVSCILIWTRGGTSHHDPFDPKPEAPASIRGEFGTVATRVPGVRFCDVAPRMAREIRRFGL